MIRARHHFALLLGASTLSLAHPAFAQSTDGEPEAVTPAPTEPEDADLVDGVVITAQRLPGAVDTDLPVELELDEAAIASYGAASVGDLLAALAPQTGSARGRGGGFPVMLINGQRVSGFRELRDLPPEAIARVQVFPEELAIQYGYRPDQRVVNFILKPNFRSVNAQVGYGFATSGDFETNELDVTATRIGKSARINLNADFEPASRLLEADRRIVQARVDSVTGLDEGRFRTLLPATDPLELAATGSLSLGPRSTLSFTAGYDLTETHSLLGLPNARLAVPGTSPFSRTGADEAVTRLLPAGGALTRDGRTDAISLGATANGPLGRFQYSATASYDRSLANTTTERQASAIGLATLVAAGDPTTDPFAADLALGPRTIDTARGLSQTGLLTTTVNGSPVALPAGEAQLSVTAEGRALSLDSRSRGRVVSDSHLTRKSVLLRGSLVLPVTSRREGFGDAIGTLSLNVNGGVRALSDFAAVTEYGYGINWEPFEDLTLLASVIGEQAVPSLTQLGAPQLLTPNAPVFDGRSGATVFADVLTGGNPDLRREDRRDLKLAANWSPDGLTGERGRSTFTVEYLTNRSNDVSAGFPLLTPAIEAAFPDRVTRDAAGALVRVDQRPVTFDRLRSSRLRFGFSLSGSLGPEPQRGGGRPRGGRPEGAGVRERGPDAAEGRPPTDAPPGSEGRGRPVEGAPDGAAPAAAPTEGAPPVERSVARPAGNPIGRAFGGGRGGRWNLSVFDVWQLDSTVLIRPGVPELDLLGGDVTDGTTPIARHQVQLEGGAFKDGLGLRLTGAYTSNAVLASRGSGAVGGTAGDLAFGDLATLSARVFIDFDQRTSLVESLPVLRGGRLAFRVDNLFGGIRGVRDPLGGVPLAYQPGFLDPRGRFLEVSFRKRF